MTLGLGEPLAHVHVQVGYLGGQWDLHVLDFESGRFLPEEYPFWVSLGARQTNSSDPRLRAFLGDGERVWILPQNEAPGLLNLGIGTSGIAGGVFQGNRIRLELHQLEAPGDLAVYTTSAFGVPVGYWVSRDGVDPSVDVLEMPAINAHLHVNWAFTAPGVYRVGIVASGIRASDGRRDASAITEYSFVVEDPPAPRIRSIRVLDDDQIELTLDAAVGSRLQVQEAVRLSLWNPVITVTMESASVVVRVPRPSGDAVFYRLLVPWESGVSGTLLRLNRFQRGASIGGVSRLWTQIETSFPRGPGGPDGVGDMGVVPYVAEGPNDRVDAARRQPPPVCGGHLRDQSPLTAAAVLGARHFSSGRRPLAAEIGLGSGRSERWPRPADLVRNGSGLFPGVLPLGSLGWFGAAG